MDDTLPSPNREELATALATETAVESVEEVDDGWLRVASAEHCLLVCLGARDATDFGRLIRGAELVGWTDVGFVFVTPVAVYALSTDEPKRGTTEALLASSSDEFTAELADFIVRILINGFGEFLELQFAHLAQLFASLLTTENVERESRPQLQPETGRSFPHTWPAGMEAEIVDLVVRWILRDDPNVVVDLCSDGWMLSTTLVEHSDDRGKDTELHHVSPPVDAARVGRLVTAFRSPWRYPAGTSEIRLDAILDDLDDRVELSNFAERSEDAPRISPDAVTAGLCSGTTQDMGERFRKRARELDFRLPTAGVSTYLAAEGMRSLTTGGRGAFVLTLGQLARSPLLRHAFSEGRIHAVLMVDLPEDEAPDKLRHLSPVVVLFEKEDSHTNSDEVRVIEVATTDPDEGVHKLVQAPDEALDSNEATDIESVSFWTVAPDDLLELDANLVLREPQLVPFLRDDDTRELGELVKGISRGVRTGADDFFYFDPEEIEKVDIPGRFLTPVLRRAPSSLEEQLHTITNRETDAYALDLREFLDEFDETPAEENVLEELRRRGYDNVVTYIEEHRHLLDRPGLQRSDVWFSPFSRQTDDPADLLFARFSDGTWYRHRADDVIIDQRWYGIRCGDTDPDALHKVLSSEPYQQLLAHFGQQMSGVHSQYTIRDLRRLPVNIGPLTEGLDDLTFPPESRRDQRRLDRAVVDRCQNRVTRETLDTLLDPDDRFAWAWFLSPDEYEEFQRRYDAEESDARGFVADRLSEAEVREMLDDIAQSPLHIERWDTIQELADEYRDGRYRLFLYGATPQFEGFIMDWARQNGHDVVERGSRPYVRISGQSKEEQKEFPKGLGQLVEEFIPRGFGDFLQDDIADLRNAIAHGEIVEPSRQRAAICLLALHTLALEVSEGRLGVHE